LNTLKTEPDDKEPSLLADLWDGIKSINIIEMLREFEAMRKERVKEIRKIMREARDDDTE
jgi:hypothetical protein